MCGAWLACMQPSYWPFVASVGLFVAAFGVLYIQSASRFGVVVAVLGAVITMVATYAWSLEPVNDPVDSAAH